MILKKLANNLKFDAILWDIDNTILHFPYQEKYALKKCFSIFKLGEFTTQMLENYREISDNIWKEISTGKLSKNEGLIERFEQLFKSFNINFSAKKFNEEYQCRLGDKVKFNDNAYKILNSLKPIIKQYATTDGTIATQKNELKNGNLLNIFDDIFISEAIGFSKPDVRFFDYIFKHIPSFDKNKIIIVGDSLTSDMQGGVNAGIKCCWYNPNHKKNNSKIPVDFEIDNLKQIYDILL